MPNVPKPTELQHSRPASERHGAGRFCVGNINPGTVRSEYMASIIALMQDTSDDAFIPEGWDYTIGGKYRRFEQLIVNSPAGPYLDCERNVVVNKFMRMDADVLVFIDSDISFHPRDVYQLADLCTEDDPVVGGWYENDYAEHGRRPVAMQWEATDSYPRLTPVASPDSAWIANPIPRPVDIIGTGFMAIHRSLLDAMIDTYDPPTPWFAELALYGQQMGEDVTFCMRVKSMKKPSGDDDFYQILFAPIPVTHYKTATIIPHPLSSNP